MWNLPCYPPKIPIWVVKMAAPQPPPSSAQQYVSVSKSDGDASEADMLVTKTTPDHLRKSKW